MKNVNILKDLNTLNKLHTSSVESHTTNNGIVDFACDNAGYVDNVVIEGKTLVNLSDLAFINDPIGDNITRTQFSNKNRCTNGEYTLINFADIPIFFTILNISTQMYTRGVFVDGRTSVVERLNEDESIYGVDFNLVDGWQQGDTSIFKSSLFMVLEGDHTDKPISYFEGLKSVGQGDKIEVLSREHNKTNLLKSQNVTYKDNYMISYASGLESASNNHKYTETYIEIEPNTDYCFYHTSRNICWYDENKNFILKPLNKRILDENVNKDLFFSAKSPSNAKYLRVTIIKGIHNNGKTSEIYKGKYDHKQISTTLRSLPNGVKDTIEKRGNKYVKVQRCGEVTLNGNESDDKIVEGVPTETTYRFGFYLSNLAENPPGVICVSDKFSSECNNNWMNDKEQVDQDKASVNIRILKTKLADGTKASIKSWLKSNPITIVYQLATPQIIELPNFNPQTYKGNNTLLINSGVIQCDASFDVYKGVRSELDVIKDKVSSLDDFSSNYNYKNIASEITFLNGWNRWGNDLRFNAFVVDNIVKICILLEPGVKNHYTPVFTMPKEYAPQTKEFIACVDQNQVIYAGCLDETGMFQFDNDVSELSFWICINLTYPLRKKVF